MEIEGAKLSKETIELIPKAQKHVQKYVLEMCEDIIKLAADGSVVDAKKVLDDVQDYHDLAVIMGRLRTQVWAETEAE